MHVTYLTLEDVLQIHSFVMDETGGSHGVRDMNLVLALLDLPKQAVFGKELYPGIHEKAAVYVRNIIFSHPFIDGNKRSAMTCLGVFLAHNACELGCAEWEVERFALSVIEERLDIAQIAAWVREHTHVTED